MMKTPSADDLIRRQEILQHKVATPLADDLIRRRYGLPHDFDVDSVPFSHLEAIGRRYQREVEAKKALEPPKIIPQFFKTAAHLAGDRRIIGIAATGAITLGSQSDNGCKLHAGGCTIILPIPLLVDHDVHKCVGSIEAASIDADGAIRIWANLDRRCDADTWKKIQSGELGSLSLDLDWPNSKQVMIDGIKNIMHWRLKEVSICHTGRNHQAVVTEVWPPADREPVATELPKLVELGKRIEVLEARPAMKYCGVWDPENSYAAGEFVTENGALWACRSPTKARPGKSADWQLAVKKGEKGADIYQVARRNGFNGTEAEWLEEACRNFQPKIGS
jgi:hypothetical protein